MLAIINPARIVRRRFLPPNATLVRAARAATRWALARAYPHGVPVQIGAAGTFRIIPSLAVGSLDYASWGGGKNVGFVPWLAACRGKRVVCDIGAHVGLTALPVSHVLAPDGVCYAFEPSTANADTLEQHIVMNGCSNIVPIRALVGADDRDEVPFHEQSSVVGMNSIVVTKDAEQYHQTTHPQVTLDAFCAARGILPEVIKMDIEGGELGALQGARNVLARARPRIFLSVHPRHLTALGASIAQLAASIAECRYRVTDVMGSPADVRVCSEVILEPL